MGLQCLRLLELTTTMAVVAAWLIGGVGSAAAQTNTAEIAGVVRDSLGETLPHATVSARHLESGSVVQRVADERGRYFIPALRVGDYLLTAEMPGFRRVLRAGVRVVVGQTLTVDFTLEPGGISEEITVTAERPLLQSTNAEISDVLENREVVQFPLNGRNFLALAQMSDGVVIPPGGTRGEALQQAGPLPNVGGQRSGHNIYMLDGVKVTDELFNNLVISPSVDSIQEFKIQKSQYPAEFGGKASALINVVTRSGTNLFRGNAFEFFRHQALDARNFFDRGDSPKPPLRQHQFGGTLGGPIVRNRSFFFASGEAQRMRRSQTRTFAVPDTAVRQGDFAGLETICDPLAAGAATGTCTPFAGNRIPATRIDPLALAFLQRIPLPTSSGTTQNLTAVGHTVKNVEQLSLRVDHRILGDDQVFARFSTFDADEDQPFGTSSLQETLMPGFGRSLDTRSRNAAIGHNHVFGNAALHEFRFGWLDVSGGQESVNRGDDTAARNGLQGVMPAAADRGYPQVSTRGFYSTFGDPTSFVSRHNQHFELYSSLLLERGAHRFKLGGYYFHLWFRPEQPDNARGSFTYTGQFSGNPFADFLLGYPTAASVGIGRGDQDGRTNWVHMFAQDDWQIGSNLTVNLGLRYEYNQHMRDEHNRLSSIDLATPGGRFVIASDESGTMHPSAHAMLDRLPLPFVTSAAASWDRGLLKPGPLRFAPRSGLAYTFNDGRGVVRGGYGIFLNQWAYSVQTAFSRNLPFFQTTQVDVPTTERVPLSSTRDILANDSTIVTAPTIMDYAYRVEYTQTWSGGLQYALLPGATLELGYMGSWTLGADNATVHNVPEPGPGPIQARRPIPQLGPIRSIRFDGKSIYHAVTTRFERRPRRGLAFGASYTWSSSVDDASSPGPTEAETNFPQDVRNIFDESGEWAPSSFDHRHVVIASGSYELPGLTGRRRLTRAIFGAWRVNAMFFAQSGAPFTVNLGLDRANVGPGPAQRPNQVRNPNLANAQRVPERWFDTTAFELPQPFTFGSARRNSVLGPGFATLDVALAKTWVVGGSRDLELRVEVFNLLNKANFDLPNRIFGTPNFGRVFSAKSPRELQLGLKVGF